MQRKKIQEAMKNVYFQKMTANGYHEIEEQIAKLQQQRPAKIYLITRICNRIFQC